MVREVVGDLVGRKFNKLFCQMPFPSELMKAEILNLIQVL